MRRLSAFAFVLLSLTFAACATHSDRVTTPSDPNHVTTNPNTQTVNPNTTNPNSLPNSSTPDNTVLGQSDANTVWSYAHVMVPHDVFVVGSKMLVADSQVSRVLVYNSIPRTGQLPDIVLGALTPSASYAQQVTQGTASNILSAAAVWSDGNRILVADQRGNRVLVWNSWPTANGQAADWAIGQPANGNNLTSTAGGVGPTSLAGPTGVWSDGTSLFVSDASNNRVLIWNTFPTSASQAADLAVGQRDLVSNNYGANANTLYGPRGVYYSNGHLYVVDVSNNRVLGWNSKPTTSGQPADFVLGQPNFTSTSTGQSPNELNVPVHARGDGTHLLITDQRNCRVLVYDSLPDHTGQLPSYALGIAPGSGNLSTSCPYGSPGAMVTPYAAFSTGTEVFVADWSLQGLEHYATFPSASATLYTDLIVSPPENIAATFSPTGVAVAAGQLFVTDYANRVLVWNAPPSHDNQAADFALGQPPGPNNLTSATSYVAPTTSAATVYNPTDVATDGTRLFVADFRHARVLVWNQLPTSPVPADFALGQPDLNTSTAPVTASPTNMVPSSVASNGNILYVADDASRRILGWSPLPTSNGQPADFVLGQQGLSVNNNTSGPNGFRPEQVRIINGWLFAADTYNSRVLVWKSLPTTTNTPPDFALGQPDTSTLVTPTAPSASNMYSPSGITSDGTRLYIADSQYARVLIWNTFPNTSGAPATSVYGQADFVSQSIELVPSISTAAAPAPLFYAKGQLYIGDGTWNRLVVIALPN